MLPPPGPASPVPAYSVPSEAAAIAPIGCGFEAGQSCVSVAPASVLFQTPPDAVAT